MGNAVKERLKKEFWEIIFDDSISLDKKVEKIQSYWKELDWFSYNDYFWRSIKVKIKTVQENLDSFREKEGFENPFLKIIDKIAKSYLEKEATIIINKNKISKTWRSENRYPKIKLNIPDFTEEQKEEICEKITKNIKELDIEVKAKKPSYIHIEEPFQEVEEKKNWWEGFKSLFTNWK